MFSSGLRGNPHIHINKTKNKSLGEKKSKTVYKRAETMEPSLRTLGRSSVVIDMRKRLSLKTKTLVRAGGKDMLEAPQVLSWNGGSEESEGSYTPYPQGEAGYFPINK